MTTLMGGSLFLNVFNSQGKPTAGRCQDTFEQVQFWSIAWVSNPTSFFFASAIGSGIVQPDAALCPPPPNIAATCCTSTPGFARRETRVEFASPSLSSAETSTPSI